MASAMDSVPDEMSPERLDPEAEKLAANLHSVEKGLSAGNTCEGQDNWNLVPNSERRNYRTNFLPETLVTPLPSKYYPPVHKISKLHKNSGSSKPLKKAPIAIRFAGGAGKPLWRCGDDRSGCINPNPGSAVKPSREIRFVNLTSNPKEEIQGAAGKPREEVKGEAFSTRKEVQGATSSPREEVQGVAFSPREEVQGATSSSRVEVQGAAFSPREKIQGRASNSINYMPQVQQNKKKSKAKKKRSSQPSHAQVMSDTSPRKLNVQAVAFNPRDKVQVAASNPKEEVEGAACKPREEVQSGASNSINHMPQVQQNKKKSKAKKNRPGQPSHAQVMSDTSLSDSEVQVVASKTHQTVTEIFMTQRLRHNQQDVKEDRHRCPGCHRIYVDQLEGQDVPIFCIPRIITKCGHNICESCLEYWMFKRKSREISCKQGGCSNKVTFNVIEDFAVDYHLLGKSVHEHGKSQNQCNKPSRFAKVVRGKDYKYTPSKRSTSEKKDSLKSCVDCSRDEFLCITCFRFVCGSCKQDHLKHKHEVVVVNPDLTIPERCDLHEAAVLFYFPEFERFGCTECKEEMIFNRSIAIAEFKLNKSGHRYEGLKVMESEVKGRLDAWFAVRPSSLETLRQEDSSSLHTQIHTKFAQLHRLMDLEESKLHEKAAAVCLEEKTRREKIVVELNLELFQLLTLRGKIGEALSGSGINLFKLQEMKLELDQSAQAQPTHWRSTPFLALPVQEFTQLLGRTNLQVLWPQAEINHGCSQAGTGEETDMLLESGDQVVLSCLHSPSEFYLQRQADLPCLHSMMLELELCALDQVVEPVCGQLLSAEGYRVVVLSTEGDMVQVRQVDTGVKLWLKLKDMYVLPEKLRKNPLPLARLCRLRYIEPTLRHGDTSWSRNSILVLRELGCSRSLTLSSLRMVDSVLEVELCLPLGPRYSHYSASSLGDILVFRGLVYARADRPRVEHPYPYTQIEYSREDEVQVVVEKLSSPDHIYVRPSYRSYSQMAAKVEQEFQSDYAGMEPLLVPAVNLPCVYLGKEGRVYRAVVTKLLQEAKVTVLLVDKGCQVTCSADRLMKLLLSHLKIPCLLREVRLDDLLPLGGSTVWSEAVNKTLKQIVLEGKELRMCVEQAVLDSSSLSVVLYEPFRDVDVSINALLAYMNLAQTQTHLQVKFPKPVEKPPGEGIARKFQQKCFREETLPWKPLASPLVPPDLTNSRAFSSPANLLVEGTKVQCRISSIVSPSRMFVIPEDFLNREIELNNQITEEVKRAGVPLANISGGDLCLARTSLCYYARGRVLSRGPDQRWSVYFVDSGVIEECHHQDIHQYPDHFKGIPELCTAVHMTDLHPTGGRGWSLAAKEKIQSVVEEHGNTLIVEVKGECINVDVNGVTVSSIPVNLVHVRQDLVFPRSGDMDLQEKRVDIADKYLVKKGLAICAAYRNEDESILKKILENLRPEEARFFQPPLCNPGDFPGKTEGKRIAVPVLQMIQDFQWKENNNPLSEEFSAVVPFIDKEGYIYLQSLEEHQANLKTLKEGLTIRFRNSVSREVDRYINRGEPVILQGSLSCNDTWYRGRVLNVNKKGLVKVELVDYGEKVECSPYQLRKRLHFTEIPLQRFRARLNCLPVKEVWDRYAIDFLMTNIAGPSVKVKVKQFGGGDDDLIVALTLSSGKDASTLLMDCRLARPLLS